MRILGIESSCDETACAVVEDGVRVRSETDSVAVRAEGLSDTVAVTDAVP